MKNLKSECPQSMTISIGVTLVVWTLSLTVPRSSLSCNAGMKVCRSKLIGNVHISKTRFNLQNFSGTFSCSVLDLKSPRENSTGVCIASGKRLTDLKITANFGGNSAGMTKVIANSDAFQNEQPFKSPSNTPTIDIKGPLGSEETRIAVYCEGQHITSTPNFYEAVMCAYSIHWLFNLVYEKNCKKFFEYFDWLIGE